MNEILTLVTAWFFFILNWDKVKKSWNYEVGTGIVWAVMYPVWGATILIYLTTQFFLTYSVIIK